MLKFFNNLVLLASLLIPELVLSGVGRIFSSEGALGGGGLGFRRGH